MLLSEAQRSVLAPLTCRYSFHLWTFFPHINATKSSEARSSIVAHMLESLSAAHLQHG